MNNIEKNFVDEDGQNGTIIASSSDDYSLNLDKKYQLNNYKSRNKNDINTKFKNSIFGRDIGIKSGGFSSVAILATVIALAALAIIYFIFRV